MKNKEDKTMSIMDFYGKKRYRTRDFEKDYRKYRAEKDGGVPDWKSPKQTIQHRHQTLND